MFFSKIQLNKLLAYNTLIHSIAKRNLCAKQTNKLLVFRQLFDQNTYTYTYILGDQVTREAVIIDPVLEKVERDLAICEQLGLNLKYASNQTLLFTLFITLLYNKHSL
jgi:hypothetical protein